MANKEYRDERGTYIWRTIGGRHIKIYTGQTLAEAMKESGKFKKVSDIKREEYHSLNDKIELEKKQKEMDEIDKEYSKNITKENYEKHKKALDEWDEARTRIDTRENPRVFVESSLDLPELEGKHINESYDQAIDRIDKIQNLDERKQAITDYVNKTGTSRDAINDALAEKEYDRHLGKEYDKRFGNKERENLVDLKKLEEKGTLNFYQKNGYILENNDKLGDYLKKYGDSYKGNDIYVLNSETEEIDYSYYSADDLSKKQYNAPVIKTSKDVVTVLSDDWFEKDTVEKNKYATNNGSGSDDNTSAYADKALDYWKKQREDTLARGGDTAWEDDSIRRWKKEKENRLYGEKQQTSSTPIYKNPDVVKDIAFSTAKAFGSKEVTVGGQKYVMGKSGQYEPVKEKLNITMKDSPTKVSQYTMLKDTTYKKGLDRKIDLNLSSTSNTAGKDAEILNSIVGQLSDGIWENSPNMDRYWTNMDFTDNEGKIKMNVPKSYYNWEANSSINRRPASNPFLDKSDDKIRTYIADKAKQIVKTNIEDDPSLGKWSRDNTNEVEYMGGHNAKKVSVADVYSFYDRVKGRTGKQYNTFDKTNFSQKEVNNLKQRYKGTYEYLKNTTNMSGAEILEYLKKIKD